MIIDTTDLTHLACLAYLQPNVAEIEQLSTEVATIIDFVQALQNTDTKGVEPLFHPLNLHQRLREDVISEENVSHQLAAIAPNFAEACYLVPKFIDAEQ